MNRIKHLFLVIIYVFFSYSGCPQKSKPPGKVEQDLGLPFIKDSDIIIKHAGFTLNYAETYEQAGWVAYELTAKETYGKYKRSDKFMSDPAIKTKSADHIDYAGSGYDRGHLAPAADMGWSLTTMQESFYYSNMSPQNKSFNRGIWKNLENQVRVWAREYDAVYIVTGPVLTPGLPVIGPNKVAVPDYYYKVILDYTLPEKKAIGFILANQPSRNSLTEYAVSVDSVEAITGINFFHHLSDKEENIIERACNPASWTWQKVSTKRSVGKQETQVHPIMNETTLPPVQCIAITQKGFRCKNKTSPPNKKCARHR